MQVALATDIFAASELGAVDGRDHEGAERRAARRRGDGERAARAVDAAVEAELAEHAPAGESGRSTAAARGGAGRVVTGSLRRRRRFRPGCPGRRLET